jgi:hypothetical protein
MRRLRRNLNDNFQDENFNPNSKYELAYKQVKRIKGFYVHVLVYVSVNIFLIGSQYYDGTWGIEKFVRWESFSTAIFWGIGLVAHGLSVFGRNLFFSTDWEEKKIKELMDKDKDQKWE